MAVEVEHLVNADQLRTLLAIAETRSFSRAAAQLGVTQPSVSQQVKRIERLTGRALFRRRRAGIELTSDGNAVVIFARAMLELTEDLRRQLNRAGEETQIRLGMSEDFCRTALPSVLWVFTRSYPNIDLHILSGDYASLTQSLEAGTIDFVIMRRYAGMPRARVLWTDGADWAGRGDLSIPATDPVPLCVPAKPNPARDLAIDVLERAGRTWRIRFEGTNVTTIEAALQTGLGVFLLPNRMQMHAVERIGRRLGLPPAPDVEFVLARRSGDLGGAVLAFIEMIQHAAKSSFE